MTILTSIFFKRVGSTTNYIITEIHIDTSLDSKLFDPQLDPIRLEFWVQLTSLRNHDFFVARAADAFVHRCRHSGMPIYNMFYGVRKDILIRSHMLIYVDFFCV